jgi:uridine kinase
MRELLEERSLPRRMTLTIHVGSADIDVPMGTVVGELLPKRVDDQLVVGALVDHRAKSLTHRLSASARLEPLTTAHWEGQRIYQRSLGLMLVEAASRVAPQLVVRLGHSVGLGQRVIVVSDDPIDAPAVARRLAEEMRVLEAEDAPLREEWWMVGEAIAYFQKQGWAAAAKLLDTHYDPAVRLVSYGHVHALRPAPFLPSTGLMRNYDVIADERGILLVFGSESAKTGTFSAWPGQEEVFSEVRVAAEHTGKMMEHHARWLETLGIDSVGAFNRACVTGDVSQLIRVSEGFQEKQLSTIADVIHDRGDAVKVICIAGPSSSGKSTFIRRLTVQLQVNGMAPVGLGLDDYYVDRDDTPLDDDGELDFEAFGAIRAELLANHVSHLLAGETVRTARYDFKRGKSLPEGGKEMKLLANEVLILEGIHGLNPQLLESVADDRIYRIFICPLAQLPFDRVSRLHASDLRLVRRIVRDRHNRGSNAAATITRWPSVRRGERRNIFPYQHLADAVFDTSLIYELSVLRVFAERYLLEVPQDDPAYPTAHRLLTLLSRFITIYPDHVPPTSILREFIGGSGFEY